MRYSWFALVWVAAMASAAWAQKPDPRQPAPKPDRLDTLLAQWEEKMTGLQTLSAECTRTTVDKTYQGTEVFVGTAKYMKPNLAHLKMEKKNNAKIVEEYLCTGTFLYEYVPQQKVVRVHELPPPKQGQVADDNLLSFLFGMKAAEAKKRYELKLVKEDQHYAYIEILPRNQADKADFQKARLVLWQNTMLPRQLWFEQANGNEVTWDIPKSESNAKLNRNDFAPPSKLPDGWNLQRVPKQSSSPQASPKKEDPPPRVIRPNR